MSLSCWSWVLSASGRKSQTSQPSCQLAWWHGHGFEGPLVRDPPHGNLQMEPSAQQKELGAGSWSSSGGHLDVATAGSTWLQSLQTPRKLVPLELWPASPGEVPCVHPWGRVFLSPMPPSSPLERRRWQTSGPTLRCPNIPDVTYGRKKGPCRYWIHGHQAAWARRGHLDESWDGKVPWGKSASPWRTWRRRSQCSRSSLSPCAIRAVEAIVSWRDGWSNHETLSVTSVSPTKRPWTLALS